MRLVDVSSPRSSRRLLGLLCWSLCVTALLGVLLAGTAGAFVVLSPKQFQSFALPGFRGDGSVGGPVDVTVGADATMWLLDEDGALWHVVGRRLRRVTGAADAVGRQIAVDGWGRVAQLVRDARGRIVLRRTWPDGRHSDVRVPAPDEPQPTGDLVAGPGGTIWFARVHIGKGPLYTGVNPNGHVVNVPTVRSYPGTAGQTLDTGPDGNLWFDSGHGVGRFSPKGKLLPWIGVVPDSDLSSNVVRVVRGSDDAIWAGIDNNGALARIDPIDASIASHPLFRADGPDEDFRFWALTPASARGVALWMLSGEDTFDDGGGETIWADNLQPFGPAGMVSEQYMLLPHLSGPSQDSAEHYGLVAGLDGRMWFTERRFGKLEAWHSPWWKPSPRGRTTVLGVHRVGRFARVDLGCVGTTGGYCTGSLQLRANGRLVGRAARYAVVAGPPAVKSRSARWLPIPRADRSRRVHLTVQRHRVPGL
jgi:hypothetical protein